MPITTYSKKGNRLFGYTEGLSPINPVSCAPQGLKYLREIRQKSLWATAKDFIMYSTQTYIFKFCELFFLKKINTFVSEYGCNGSI